MKVLAALMPALNFHTLIIRALEYDAFFNILPPAPLARIKSIFVHSFVNYLVQDATGNLHSIPICATSEP